MMSEDLKNFLKFMYGALNLAEMVEGANLSSIKQVVKDTVCAGETQNLEEKEEVGEGESAEVLPDWVTDNSEVSPRFDSDSFVNEAIF